MATFEEARRKWQDGNAQPGITYHPHEYYLPSNLQNNDNMDATQVKTVADDMIRQSEEKERLETPEELMAEIESNADASKEDFF